jgi:hypothetical protein
MSRRISFVGWVPFQLAPSVLLLCLIACGPAEEGANRATGLPQEFQAGDTLVKVMGDPLYAGVASLDLELTIGMREGPPEYTLSGVAELLPLDDGSVLVHDHPYSGGASLRRYAENGEFLGYLGRFGEGPGEFKEPAGLTKLPDGRILFADTRLNRINVYSAHGEFLDTWTLGALYQTIINAPGQLTASSRGVVYLKWMMRPTGAAPEDRSRFVRLTQNGAVIDTLRPPSHPPFPASGRVRKVRQLESGGRGTIGFVVPYYPRFTWALSPLGYFITGRTDRYAIDLRIPDSLGAAPGGKPPVWEEGQPILSLRRTVEPVPVSREERTDQYEYIQARLDRYSGRLENPIPPVPEHKPFFRQIRVGQEGRIWVAISAPSVRQEPDPMEVAEGRPTIGWNEPWVYDVLEPDGTYLGQVRGPGGAWISTSAGDTVWVVTRDEMDIPFVRRYRIVWN